MGFEGPPSFEKKPEEKKPEEQYKERLRTSGPEMYSENLFRKIMRSRAPGDKANFQADGFEIDQELGGKGLKIEGFIGKVDQGPEKIGITVTTESPELQGFAREMN